MTDRELLEAAAKAAGIKIDKSPYNGGGHGNTGFDVLGNAVLDWHNGVKWNPLIDDGDALRLAVKLRISVIFDEGVRAELGDDSIGYLTTSSIASDTRRAIVRAAAALTPKEAP